MLSVLHVDIVPYFHEMFYVQAHIIFEPQSVLCQEFPRTMFNHVKNVKNYPGCR